jgi:hypothetical protein
MFLGRVASKAEKIGIFPPKNWVAVPLELPFTLFEVLGTIRPARRHRKAVPEQR